MPSNSSSGIYVISFTNKNTEIPFSQTETEEENNKNTQKQRRNEDVEIERRQSIISKISASVKHVHNIEFKKNQYFASLAANFGALALGSMFGWSATALADMRLHKSEIGIETLDQESFIGSIVLFFCMVVDVVDHFYKEKSLKKFNFDDDVGAFFSGPLIGLMIDNIGRRMSILLLSLPCLAGWSLIIFAANVEMIYGGRFLTGLAGGAYSIVVPIYVAETSDPDIRGKLSAGFDMGLASGILYILFLGTLVGWRFQAALCGIITIIGHILVIFSPETPRYLVSKERREDAIKSLCWIHNTKNEESVMNELRELELNAEEQRREQGDAGCLEGIRALFRPHVLKPCSVAFMIHLFSSISANIAITAYTVDIFIASGTALDAHIASIIFGITNISAIFAALVVDKYGRRPLLIISQFLMTLTLGVAGLFFLLKHMNDGVSPRGLDWLPVTTLGIYIAAFALGTGPISFMLMGEILPPEAKGILGTSIVCGVKWISAFLVTKFFLDIMVIFGEAIGYWIFAGFCLIGGLYVIFGVPETKGKTLEEIQQLYTRK